MPDSLEYHPEQSYKGEPHINETGDQGVLTREFWLHSSMAASEAEDWGEVFEMITNNFAELRALNINLPDPRLFQENGQDDLSVKFKILVEKVDGKDLDLLSGIDIKSQIEALYTALIQYLDKKIEAKEPFLYDIFGEHQYRFGHTNKDSEDKIYLVDVGPEFLKWQSGPPYFSYILAQINEIEEQFEIKMESTRQKLSGIMEKYSR